MKTPFLPLRRMLRGLLEDSGMLHRGLRLVLMAAPAAMGLYVALALALGLVPVAQAWLSKVVVDRLAGDPSPGVLVPALLYVLTLVVTGALQPVERTLSQRLTDLAVAAVDRELMAAGGRMADLYRVERPAFGDELRLADQAGHYLTRPWRATWIFAGNLLAFTGLLILLGTLHPLLPVVLAVLAVPHLLVERRTGDLLYERMADLSRAGREMDYCVRVTTEADAAKEVRVFGLGGFFLRRYEERRDRALWEVNAVRLQHLRRSAALVALHAAAVAGGFWYVATQAGAGHLTAGDVVLYLAAVLQAQSQLGAIPGSFALLHRTQRHMRDFFEFLDLARPAILLPSPGHARSAPARLRHGVELRNVRFAYPEGATPVFENVSFTLEEGRVTALVGPNGAGKSTLVKLLTRMYDPTEGGILLDGHRLSEYDLASLRLHVGVVYQDFARFSLTLRENIAVGAGQPGAGNGRVEQAARWAGADAVAAGLPQGYDTDLTRRFEGGVELSGGEWQKLALARGFVRDAALVILDEPTAALDAEAEYRLFLRFKELVVGKTGLLISHRFSTVRMADHIVVLEGGRVIEQGSHEALMARGGRYAALFELQAGWYR